jgi:glycerate dehydrogenase
MHAVFLDQATIKPEDLDLDCLYKVIEQWNFFDWTAQSEIIERSAGASVIVTNKVVLSREELQALPDLKLICICATGTNNVDLVAARELSITVCNVSGYAQQSVAQHTFALMLALASNWHRYDQAVKEGVWSKSKMFCMLDYPAQELAGKTLGIVGYGSLGQSVKKLATAFGMDVIIAKAPWHTAQYENDGLESWDTFLATSDIISIHCPLTEESHNLFDEENLSKMRKGALLINTARGGIVNEEALLEALSSGHLGGAALDVLEQEPPSSDHPLINTNLHNLLVTPHCAWVSVECRQRLIEGVALNIQCFIEHKPRNVVNP